MVNDLHTMRYSVAGITIFIPSLHLVTTIGVLFFPLKQQPQQLKHIHFSKHVGHCRDCYLFSNFSDKKIDEKDYIKTNWQRQN
jgi:hypothetical protein